VLQTFWKRSGWQGQDAGRRPVSRAMLMVLAVRRSFHEARAVLAFRRQNAMKPRIQYVLTQ
jgi:hypothetical protein